MENNLKWLDGNAAYLVKFMKEEFVSDFLKGKIYMNTLKYFIDLENKTKTKGQGDRYEANAVLRNVETQMYLSGTDILVATGTVKEINFYSEGRVNTPVFCMYSVDSESLKVKNDNDDYISLTPIIDENEKQKLIKDFGDTLLAINPRPFLDRVAEACRRESLGLIYSKVKYYDYGVNSKERTDKYNDIITPDICFMKDEELQYQNEFRFILENVVTDKPYILEIGDISDIVVQMKISDFFSDKLELRFKKAVIQEEASK